MFVRADLDQVGLGSFQWMPHAIGLVTFGGEPAPVPEPLVRSLARRLEGLNLAEDRFVDDLRRGDPVEINDGPLAGYQAIFDSRLSGKERVRVLLTLLHGRKLSVELRAEMLDRTTRR